MNIGFCSRWITLYRISSGFPPEVPMMQRVKFPTRMDFPIIRSLLDKDIRPENLSSCWRY